MTWSYDAIAEVYATDMGRSMPFDDVGWYRAFCREQGGAVLELGCGTGRILVELLAAGLDVTGADRSLPMLQRLRRDAAARGLDANVLQTDLRAVAVRGRFATILLPYSLITYLTDPRVAVDVLAGLRALLTDTGCVVLDAFVPKPVESFADFRLDYRRPHDDGFLERRKRITANDDGTNRIERQYRVLATDDTLLQAFDTDETIRPYAPAQLHALAQQAGYVVQREVRDYSDAPPGADLRFVTLILRP